MDHYKWGHQMPQDAMVYVWTHYPKERSIDPHNNQMFYIYDPADGLWASDVVRYFWRTHPHLHPHTTLFGLLHQKLEIWR